MKIVLVNPYIYDFTAFDLWLRPLGLLYIASVLKKYTDSELYWIDTLDRFQEGAFPPGDPVKNNTRLSGRGKYHREPVERPGIYCDTPRTYSRYGIPFEAFKRKLDEIPGADMILITSLMTYWIDGVRVTLEASRQRFPSAKVVIGGILPTLVPKEQLGTYVNADYYVEGYGENEILKIVESAGGKVYSHPVFTGIDSLPYPAVEFLGSRECVPLLTSRGCPLRCTYCASHKLNPGFIERDSEAIYNEIRWMNETYGAKHFIIFDDALLINKRRRFLKVFQKVRETLDVRFHTPNGLHTGEVDRETADILFQSGFKTVRLSFESTSEDILSRSSGKVTVEEMVRAVENLEAAGYKRNEIDVYLLFGIYRQDLRGIEDAFGFVKGLGVNPHLSYYSPVPGTEDFVRLQEAGVLSRPVNLYETNKIYFLYNKSGLTWEEVKRLKDEASIIGNALLNR
jgi:radical SAM superfamily enzyme YgiQ (UPF0313 family)